MHDDQLRRLLQSARRLRLRHARRAAPRDHRADLAAAVRQGQAWGATAAAANAIAGGWTLSAAINLQSGFPIVQQTDNTPLRRRESAEPLTGVGFATPGDFEDRLASADHPTATWINPAAITAAPAGTFGNAPRTITDVRTPDQEHRRLVQQELRPRRESRADQVRDHQPVQPFSTSLASAAATPRQRRFGQISVQAGFMRLTQVMFRSRSRLIPGPTGNVSIWPRRLSGLRGLFFVPFLRNNLNPALAGDWSVENLFQLSVAEPERLPLKSLHRPSYIFPSRLRRLRRIPWAYCSALWSGRRFNGAFRTRVRC